MSKRRINSKFCWIFPLKKKKTINNFYSIWFVKLPDQIDGSASNWGQIGNSIATNCPPKFMVVGQFGIQTNRTACYCTHHLICALMAMSIFICKLFFSHITTNEPKTYTQRHTHTFFSIASRQNCNSAENDLLAFINQVISRAHCNTRIPNGLHTRWRTLVRFWLDAVCQFWPCVSLSRQVLMILVHRYRLHLLLMFSYSIAFHSMYVYFVCFFFLIFLYTLLIFFL